MKLASLITIIEFIGDHTFPSITYEITKGRASVEWSKPCIFQERRLYFSA
jgi:hypothetical protein